MDHELKQRLIGAIVVTALAAIFVPMLFDDPVDSSSQQVSELPLPKAPNDIEKISEKQLPEDLGRALTPDDTSSTTGGTEAPGTDNLTSAETPEPKATPENNAEEELIAVESDTEDTPVRKPKTQEDNLDTGDVSSETSQPDNEDAAPVTHKASSRPKAATLDQEAKATKANKLKTDSVEAHKTANKAKEPDTEEAGHKEKAKNNSGLGRWSIQAGSFSKKENAEAMLAKLQKQGFPVTLQAKGNIYRLKIGPELDKQRAADMKKRLDKQNIQSLLIAE